jgi:hypothetical protein
MTTDNLCFYLQNRLIQTDQTGGERYNNTSPFSFPCSLLSGTATRDSKGIQELSMPNSHYCTCPGHLGRCKVAKLSGYVAVAVAVACPK